MDNALLYYVQQNEFDLASTSGNMMIDDVDEDEWSSGLNKIYPQGWARKTIKMRRLLPKQKAFIETLFHEGAATKTKLSAEQMSQRMKNHIVNGEYYIKPEEYMQITQIRNLISRITKQSKNTAQANLVELTEDEGIEQNLDEICDIGLHSDDEDFVGFDKFD